MILNHTRIIYPKTEISPKLWSLFAPFYYLNTIGCVRKLNFSSNVIESTSRKNAIFSILANCLMISLFYMIIKYTKLIFGELPHYYLIVYYTVYFLYLLNFSVVSIVNLYYSKTSVKILAVLDDINSRLNTNEKLKSLKISWLLCIILLLYYVVLIFFKLYLDSHLTFVRGFFVSVSIMFDLEVIQVTFVIFILKHNVERCNEYMKDISFEYDDEDDTNIRIDRETVLDEMYIVMKEIIEVWELVKKSNKFIILLHFVTSFIQTLVYVQVLTIWSKMHYVKEVMISHTMGAVLWIIKLLLVEVVFSLTCEQLYSRMATGANIALLKASYDAKCKGTWKNMYRLMHKDFRKLSACGVFTVDVILLMQFCQVVATYTIVLLQFAIL